MKSADNRPSQEDNVISLHEWQFTKEVEKKYGNYIKYLRLLKSSDLLNETKGFIHDVQHTTLTAEVLVKGKLLIREISARVAPHGGKSESLNKIQEKLEERIQHYRKQHPNDPHIH